MAVSKLVRVARKPWAALKRLPKAGLVAAVVVLAAAGGAGAWWLNRTTPEDFLYRALAQDAPYSQIVLEESVSGGDTKAADQAVIAPDGTMKAMGTLACKGSIVGFGDLELKLEVRQINAELFANFTDIHLTSTSSPEIAQETNDYLAQNLNGKWILIEDKDPTALTLKENGVIFGTTGAASSKLSGERIAQLLRANKVLTIVSVKDVTVHGQPALQYNLSVRRSAYDGFMDDVQPGLKYKDQILDNLFEDDTADSTVVIGKASGRVLSGTDAIANPCIELLGIFDPSAVADLPSQVKIKTGYKKGDNLPVIAPASYLTTEDFARLLRGE